MYIGTIFLYTILPKWAATIKTRANIFRDALIERGFFGAEICWLVYCYDQCQGMTSTAGGRVKAWIIACGRKNFGIPSVRFYCFFAKNIRMSYG
jgi:hypothetical protein